MTENVDRVAVEAAIRTLQAALGAGLVDLHDAMFDEPRTYHGGVLTRTEWRVAYEVPVTADGISGSDGMIVTPLFGGPAGRMQRTRTRAELDKHVEMAKLIGGANFRVSRRVTTTVHGAWTEGAA